MAGSKIQQVLPISSILATRNRCIVLIHQHFVHIMDHTDEMIYTATILFMLSSSYGTPFFFLLKLFVIFPFFMTA